MAGLEEMLMGLSAIDEDMRNTSLEDELLLNKAGANFAGSTDPIYTESYGNELDALTGQMQPPTRSFLQDAALNKRAETQSAAGLEDLIGIEGDAYIEPDEELDEIMTWFQSLGKDKMRDLYNQNTDMRENQK